MADVTCAYLQANTKEKIFTKAGPEWGEEISGCILILLKSVYGLRTSGARWYEVLAEILLSLGFVPCKAGVSIWMRLNKNGTYDFIAVYVDDLFVAAIEPEGIITAIRVIFNLKGEGSPSYYLVGNIEIQKVDFTDSGETYSISARTFIEGFAKKVEDLMGSFNHFSTPMCATYRPELDDTSLLVGDEIGQCRMLVGSLQWVITLCRYDVAYATNTLARYTSAPREGHLKAAHCVVGYLKHYPKGRILFDTRPLELPESAIIPPNTIDWFQQYPNAEEELPPDARTPVFKPIQLTTFVKISM